MLAFDAVSTPAGSSTGTLSWTHTPVNTPVAVVIVLAHDGWLGTGWSASTVTYGAASLSGVSQGNANTGSAGGVIDLFALVGLANVPAGPRTVQILTGDTLVKYAMAVTVYSTTASDASQDTTGGFNGGSGQVDLSVTHTGVLGDWFGVTGFWFNAAYSAANLEPGNHNVANFNFGAAPSFATFYTSSGDLGGASSSLYGWNPSGVSAAFGAAAVVLRGPAPIVPVQSNISAKMKARRY